MRATSKFRKIRNRVRREREECPAPNTEADPRPYPSAADVVARNIRQLMDRSKSIRDPKALAEKCGISEAIVNELLHQGCAPTANALDRIASAFGVPTWTLLHPDCDRKRREAERLDGFLREMRK